MSRIRSTLVIALLGAICMAAAVPRQASPQPDPAARVHVESLEVNLTQHPAFQFIVAIPTALRFETAPVNGQLYLHIWAYSKVDSLEVRVRKAALYLDSKPGIFTPLFDPPNTGENCRFNACQNSKLALRAENGSRLPTSTLTGQIEMGIQVPARRATTRGNDGVTMRTESADSNGSANMPESIWSKSPPRKKNGASAIRIRFSLAPGAIS